MHIADTLHAAHYLLMAKDRNGTTYCIKVRRSVTSEQASSKQARGCPNSAICSFLFKREELTNHQVCTSEWKSELPLVNRIEGTIMRSVLLMTTGLQAHFSFWALHTT